ncbi:MAG: serine/threonine protein kinase [Chloroflexi bacterium]|nr:MAG: serine/threonine protein kinase [Chloroflexota bacterium]
MQPEKIGIYEVKSELGRGGMATVYRAYDPRFEREVAVKVLPSELLHADPQFRLRFEREAKIIAQLEHTAIVPVYDVGEADGQPYFVMRYMNGGSLSERIKAGGLTIEDAARILGAIAPGLDEAHSKGIVHRDIKPSNILFDKRGNPYISDFGIAKLTQAQAGNVTGSAIIGTPAYMAPEQAQGTGTDGRADIYALGIILFEMLTGKQPYEADTPMAVAIKHITDPVPHIRKINPKFSEGIDAIIQKAMAKDKNERFSTAIEMTNAILEVARKEPTKLQTKIPFPTVKAKAIAIPQKKGFNALFVILPVLALGTVAVIAGGLFLYNASRSPAGTQAPVSTSTALPPVTETSAPNDATEIPVVIVASTSTDTPPAPTDTVAPSLPAHGGADKVAFVANNEIWLMNVDGSELRQLTTDGGMKSDLQWLPDGENILFISGKTIKFYNIKTDVVDTLTTFPSASSLDAFRVSHDGAQAMISVNNEIFVIPFDLDQMRGVSKKSDLLALEPCIVPKGKTKSALIVRETRWAADDQLVAWLYKGPDTSDQVSVFDVSACDPELIDLLDNFPGTRFMPVGFQSRIMPDFDWDGSSLFVFNTSKRNNGWGELYLYNWESHKPTLLHPVSNKCCYRDARWSPDGTYLFFAFQDEGLAAAAQTLLYYVPYGEVGTGANITPIPLPEGFFKSPKEAPQPALHPAR